MIFLRQYFTASWYHGKSIKFFLTIEYLLTGPARYPPGEGYADHVAVRRRRCFSFHLNQPRTVLRLLLLLLLRACEIAAPAKIAYVSG